MNVYFFLHFPLCFLSLCFLYLAFFLHSHTFSCLSCLCVTSSLSLFDLTQKIRAARIELEQRKEETFRQLAEKSERDHQESMEAMTTEINRAHQRRLQSLSVAMAEKKKMEVSVYLYLLSFLFLFLPLFLSFSFVPSIHSFIHSIKRTYISVHFRTFPYISVHFRTFPYKPHTRTPPTPTQHPSLTQHPSPTHSHNNHIFFVLFSSIPTTGRVSQSWST